MDCCSKYSQYRNHSMGGNIDNRNNINNGSIGYYSHLHHSSLRYQQQQQQQPPSLYRLNNSSGSIYNGIGPPPTSIPISPHTNLHHQNYDHRYGHSYTNLSSYSSYTNSNSYNCNNVNFRGMMNDYYNHCDSYTRMNGIGGSTNFSYYGYHRDFYDINLHHNPRINSYNNMYTNPLGEREFNHHHHQHHQHHSHHQNIGYYHTLPNSYYNNNNNNNHHHRYLYHHNHHAVIGNNNYNSQLRGASKDTFISRIPSDIHKSNITITNEKDLCDDTGNNLNNLHTSSVSPSLQTNTTNNNNNSSCIDDTNKLNQFHRNYNPYSNCKTDPNYNDDTIDEKINHQQQSTISNDSEENQTDHQSYESNEYKSKKSITKDKDKLSNRQNSANRKAECSTPMNNLSTFDHDGSSFTSDNYFYSTKNSNYSNLQNGYHSPSQSSSCCSPFSNSPNNWNQRYSPKLSRKRCRSPKSSPSSSSLISSITINKNRILEFDFIPSKKSKRKIKSESSEDNYEYREEIKGITPLPGFQQAFGSTEIGRFSETFFSAIDSPIEFRYESEADTLSPQPWETGDSLDGPHYNLYIGASVQPMYSDNFNSIDSSIDSNHFNEIQCSDY